MIMSLWQQGKDWLFLPRVSPSENINLRLWFIAFIAYLATLVAAVIWGLDTAATRSQPVFSHLWLLPMYIFYLSLCCTFFPAPTTWIVLLMASPMVNLVPPSFVQSFLPVSPTAADSWAAVLTVIVVAAAGALGTMMANLNEYHIFTFLLRWGRIDKVRQHNFYQTAVRWFALSPFLLLAAVSFLPIPVDVVRWLAISSRYSRLRYALAYFIGRFLRYTFLAATATVLRINWTGIILLQLLFLFFILAKYLPRLRRARSKPHHPEPQPRPDVINHNP